MNELKTIALSLYMILFDPQGYTYSHGYFVGFITSVENRGYIWKTLEGTIESQKNSNYIGSYKEYKLLDCGSERSFSIENEDIKIQLISSMKEMAPVILHYKKVVRFNNFFYGDEHTFATRVEKLIK